VHFLIGRLHYSRQGLISKSLIRLLFSQQAIEMFRENIASASMSALPAAKRGHEREFAARHPRDQYGSLGNHLREE
jgi:hypothetical protein